MKPTVARLLIAAVSFATIATACGGGDGEGDAAATTEADAPVDTTIAEVPLETPAAPAADYAGYRLLPTACGAEQPQERQVMQFEAPDDMGIDPASNPRAVIATSCGDIVVELTPEDAPATVNSFVFLAESGYFDGTVSHRIVPGFVLQAGDPTATGTGGPGFVLPDELPPPGFVYERGVLAMANAGPGTGGSQFFIVLEDAALPAQFSVFGRVVEGFEVLETIATIPLGPNQVNEVSAPLQALYLEQVTIER